MLKKISPSIALLIIGIVALIAYVLVSNETETSNSIHSNVPSTEMKLSVTSDTVDISEKQREMKAIFTTNKGKIELELFHDQAPKTVENFVNLVESDFYNDVKFHRVIPGFMIQAGDPLTKDDTVQDRWGTGGPGYTFEDEIYEDNNNTIGTISMANAGPNTNGSQFFINTADNDFLNPKHTVFGKVTDGMETIKKIESVQTLAPFDRPVEPVVIESVTIKK